MAKVATVYSFLLTGTPSSVASYKTLASVSVKIFHGEDSFADSHRGILWVSSHPASGMLSVP